MKCLFWGHLSSAEVKNLHQAAQAKNQILDSNREKLRTCKKLCHQRSLQSKYSEEGSLGSLWFGGVWTITYSQRVSISEDFMVEKLLFCFRKAMRDSIEPPWPLRKHSYRHFQAKYWLQHCGVGIKELYSNNITQCNWIELNHLTFSKGFYIHHF